MIFSRTQQQRRARKRRLDMDDDDDEDIGAPPFKRVASLIMRECRTPVVTHVLRDRP